MGLCGKAWITGEVIWLHKAGGCMEGKGVGEKEEHGIPKAENCKECEFGNCYNENWCECHHPLVNPSKVQVSCGCVVKVLLDG